MVDEYTNKYGGYVIISVIIFLAFFLYLYSGQITALWSSTTNSGEYKIIKGQITPTQEFSEHMTIAELTSSNQTLTAAGIGRAITINVDLHIDNTISNDGWGSSFLSLKPIIKIGESPCLYYSPKDSKLVLVVKYKDNPYYPHYQNIDIDFPLQKWTSISATVNNRNIRVYMDGTLVKFINMDNTAVISNDFNDIIKVGEINNNIQGNIRNLSIWFSDNN